MVRLLLLLFAFSALVPSRPAMAAPAQATTACHHPDQDEQQQVPVEHKAKHTCLGCAMLPPRIAVVEAVSSLRPVYAARLARPFFGQSTAIDPPPPRAES